MKESLRWMMWLPEIEACVHSASDPVAEIMRLPGRECSDWGQASKCARVQGGEGARVSCRVLLKVYVAWWTGSQTLK
eukprot:1078761-Rhodomonas_salina.1